MRSKLSDFHMILYTYKYQVIVVTETWLCSSFSDGLLDPQGNYFVFRRDRNENKTGGGVCIFIHRAIVCTSVLINYDVYCNVEVVACNVVLAGNYITFACAYIAPNIVIDEFVRVLNCLRDLSPSKGSFIVVGDFNVPSIDWGSNLVLSDRKSRELFDWFSNLGLEQLNLEHTRGSNTLDLLFCSDPLIVTGFCCGEPFSTSDHDSLVFNIITNNKSDTKAAGSGAVNLLRQWEKADWNGFERYCGAVNWNIFFADCKGSDGCWELFSDFLNKGILTFVPSKSVPQRSGRKNCHPPKVKRLLYNKLKCWRRAKRTGHFQDKCKYNRAAKLAKRAILDEAFIKETNIVNSANLGAFYSHVNSRLTHKSGIAPIFREDGSLALTDSDKAETLNSFFVKVGTYDDGNLPESRNWENRSSNLIDTVEFNVCEVKAIINKLKISSSPGPDGFPPCLFKNLINNIAVPLCCLFRLVIFFNVVPSMWKVANVTPIFKKGSSSDPGNYRPISITSIICKIFEAVVKLRLISFLNSNNLLNESQHGFLAKHSTVTNLLECMGDWTANLDDKAGSAIVYVDFAKAFDSVSIPKLLHCLEKIGVVGGLLNCIKSFLTDRSQRVKISSSFSSVRTLRSGVPQGSVLGPVLFIVFINSITDSLPSHVKSKLFADDLKSYVKITELDSIKDFNLILSELSAWASTWQLPISCGKSNWMFIANRSCLAEGMENFSLAGSALLEVHELKDLGVLFDSKLSFTSHITYIIGRAKQRLFLLNKSFVSKEPSLLIRAFIVYIRPMLEYCAQVWSPQNKTDVARLESVQRLFTRRLRGFEGLSYKDRLFKSNLESLELRRLKFDLVLCYKIVHNLVIIKWDNIFYFETVNRTRGHNLKLYTSKPRLDTRLQFFGYRVVAVWNSLPVAAVNAPSVVTFKRCIHSVDFSMFLHF